METRFYNPKKVVKTFAPSFRHEQQRSEGALARSAGYVSASKFAWYVLSMAANTDAARHFSASDPIFVAAAEYLVPNERHDVDHYRDRLPFTKWVKIVFHYVSNDPSIPGQIVSAEVEFHCHSSACANTMMLRIYHNFDWSTGRPISGNGLFFGILPRK